MCWLDLLITHCLNSLVDNLLHWICRSISSSFPYCEDLIKQWCLHTWSTGVRSTKYYFKVISPELSEEESYAENSPCSGCLSDECQCEALLTTFQHINRLTWSVGVSYELCSAVASGQLVTAVTNRVAAVCALPHDTHRLDALQRVCLLLQLILCLAVWIVICWTTVSKLGSNLSPWHLEFSQ